jgi:hypothetical protein
LIAQTNTGEVSTLAGSQQGLFDGNGKSAKFHRPVGIFFDVKNQLLLVCDFNNNKLRKVHLNGNSHLPSILFSSFPFSVLHIYKGDVETMCEINQPLYVVETENNTILVSSQDNKVYKIIHQGIIALQI